MARLIKQQQFEENDQWQLIDNDAPVAEFSIITLPCWQENRVKLEALAKAGKLGLYLDSHETADLIGDESRLFALIGINFPKFTDGRGYSAARLLRERHGYEGELRAFGDVLIDQLFSMQRCGFDSFMLRDDQDTEEALVAFSTFTNCYQNDVRNPQPLFRRRG